MTEDVAGESRRASGEADAPEAPQSFEDTGLLRIGELSRRVGVSDHTLRAWEQRYGLLRPHRTHGGFRLYTPEDEDRLRQMNQLLADGLSPAEAAQVVLANGAETVLLRIPRADAEAAARSLRPGTPDPSRESATASAAPGSSGGGVGREAGSGFAEARSALLAGLRRFDDSEAQRLLDRLLADFAVETVLAQVVVPLVDELEARLWSGEVTVLQHHFGRHVLRSRLASLARGWSGGAGRLLVLACPSGEHDDLAALVFGVTAHRAGCRVVYLGPDTPLADIARELGTRRPLTVLFANRPLSFALARADLRQLAAQGTVVLCGPGATPEACAAAGATHLPGDPVSAALRAVSLGAR